MNNSDKIKIAFITNGGAGAVFVYANFLLHLRNYLKDENIWLIVYGHKSEDLNSLVFDSCDFVDEYHSAAERSNAYAADVVISINFYCDVLYEADEIKKKSSRLHELLETWRSFLSSDRERNYLSRTMHRDFNTYVYARINNKCFLNIADVRGILGVPKDFVWRLDVSESENIIHQYGLSEDEYITLQSGATPGAIAKVSPKQWPNYHFEELIRLLKIMYPQKMIVQLGEDQNSEAIRGIDVNLLGKTNWRQLAAIIKHAWLHIDGECGMVHLRAALHAGTSVVLFGVTSTNFYGYKQNINMRASATCPYPCARLTDTWLERCMKGVFPSPCMDENMPFGVMDRIVMWDRMNMIKQGRSDEAVSFKNQEIYDNDSIVIDSTYKKRYLEAWNIYHYEIKEISFKELEALVMTEEGFKWLPLEDSPAYLMALGDEGSYAKYIELLRENNNDTIHSVETYKKLLNDLEKDGYDEKNVIIVNPRNRIMDGQHRASYLAAKNGLDNKVRVLVLYSLRGGNWEMFPYNKVVRDGNIYLYGAGGIGESFLDQLLETKYCNVKAMVDRSPDNWNLNPKKREKKTCILPEDIVDGDSDYDQIVISTKNDVFIDQIVDKLVSLGVPKEKIVTRAERGI